MLFSFLMFLCAGADPQNHIGSSDKTSSFHHVRTHVRQRVNSMTSQFLRICWSPRACYFLSMPVLYWTAPTLVLNFFDTYQGPPLPKEFQQGNIMLTTPVLQAMQSLRIEQGSITNLLVSHPDQDHIIDGRLHITSYVDPKNSTRRITGLWK